MSRNLVTRAVAGVAIAGLAFAVEAPLAAQRGDREGHAMEQVWRRFEVPESPPLAPAEALATLRVAPRFRVELVDRKSVV